ncbi:MAG: type II toxin-antitoxin system Phd/YefM family antitoxin [Gemmatimonadetes bacterium]|nr:type II toxin-antitoxin system Phd/YefM family antitoxin [Gemmatimonadota bacterium]
MDTWNIIDATDHFDDLLLNALDHRPQRIEQFGRGAVVVMDAGDYQRLVERYRAATASQTGQVEDAADLARGSAE